MLYAGVSSRVALQMEADSVAAVLMTAGITVDDVSLLSDNTYDADWAEAEGEQAGCKSDACLAGLPDECRHDGAGLVVEGAAKIAGWVDNVDKCALARNFRSHIAIHAVVVVEGGNDHVKDENADNILMAG